MRSRFSLLEQCPVDPLRSMLICKQTGEIPWMEEILHQLAGGLSHYRRKFRSQTSDNMDRWKAEQGRGREKRRLEERRSEKRKSQKKEDADARKGRKVAKHCVFPTWARLAARSFSLQIGQLSAALGHVGDYLPDAVGSPQLVSVGLPRALGTMLWKQARIFD